MVRLKSKWVWTSILAQVIVILQLTGLLSVSNIEMVNGVVVAILEILTIIGVLNNPKEKEF